MRPARLASSTVKDDLSFELKGVFPGRGRPCDRRALGPRRLEMLHGCESWARPRIACSPLGYTAVTSARFRSRGHQFEEQAWGEERLTFLRRFLPYGNGIPSHDTLNGVINALDPELFQALRRHLGRRIAHRPAGIRRHRRQDLAPLPMLAPRAARRCTSSRLSAPGAKAVRSRTAKAYGPAASGWCSAKRRLPASRTKSRPSRGCSSGSSSPVLWSPSTPSAVSTKIARAILAKQADYLLADEDQLARAPCRDRALLPR